MTPTQTLANALPKDPDDHGPIAVPSDAVRAVLARLDAHKGFVLRMNDAAQHATRSAEVVDQLTLAMDQLADDLAAIPDGGA